METFTDQIRQAIRKSGKTPYLIAKESGISEATLSRFLHGSGMQLSTLDALAVVLGLEVTTPQQRERISKP